ncbi:hypothetical protein HETIRDRAFT_416339 [Heterobasidion irregulare TC 32-1]|uniref:Heterokaryon incompatibility domain-containing protein n=1 Tax=Heterobasidion irregulare (strain TC 32-1) TaxID=747525 RepID=W4KFQ3_HETIT|nr:uncharacterized protein HETIRDRAFT_416339 [Heterobasidion irregulare TC 32-1]ETW84673.1 hypothetical protein HETIRDRAFT_416339 [Heterobasidion irregulare TC 32-1]
MTDKNTHTLLADWQRRTRQLSESHPNRIQLWEDRVYEDLNLLETLFYRLASSSKSPSREVAPYFAGMASIAVTIAGVRGTIFPRDMSTAPNKPSHSFPVSFFIQIKDTVRSNGWCPLAIKRFLEPSIILLEYASTCEPSIYHGAECTEEACTRNTINATGYKPQHTTECPSAYAYTIPPKSGVYDLLQRGRIPVIQRQPNGTLCVRDASETPYVAISEVWVDGLGGTTEKGLPTCQIERLAKLVHALLPGGAFWMDSLCVPEVRAMRKQAIRQMGRTYADASAVLVTDAGIRCYSRSSALEDVALGVLTSGWMQRLWTLQEGLLAKKLIFELSDGFASLDSFFPDPAMQWANPLLSQCLSKLYHFTRRHNQRLLSIPGARTEFIDLVRFLFGRWTSKPEDETIAVCGLLNVDPITLFDIEPLERLKTLLIQVGRLPSDIVFMDCPKMEVPGFRWAPKSLMRSDFRVGHECRAVCTAEGLDAEYHCARFAQVVIPAGITGKLLIQFDDQGAATKVLDGAIGRLDVSYACNVVLLEKDLKNGKTWMKGALGLLDTTGLSECDQGTNLRRDCEYLGRAMFIPLTNRALEKRVAEKPRSAIVIEATLEKLRVLVR